MESSGTLTLQSIVLIDDDLGFIHGIKRILQTHRELFLPEGPLEILTFNNPQIALEQLPRSEICIVLIDQHMPGCTGLDFLPKIIQANTGPVVMLTGNDSVKVAAAAFRAGVADFIHKSDVAGDAKRLGHLVREMVHRYQNEQQTLILGRQLAHLNLELEARNKQLLELTETAHHFVDDVAHDLRTPLTVIEQYASVIADGISGSITQRQFDHLSIITEATRNMAEMVDDFLDSSKLRVKALAVEREPHTVNELFELVKPQLEVRAGVKKMQIQYEQCTGQRQFFADLSKAGRTLVNLAVNAIKVSPASGQIKIWAQQEDAGGIRIGVTDQGPGIQKDYLKVIFERFKQMDQPQVSGSKGFGLGLSIVKQLSWLNLGMVNVQSEPGTGSTFSFTLPGNHLRQILTGYLRAIEGYDEIGNIQMLRISCDSPEKPRLLQRIVCSCCWPMDLVLQDPKQHGLITLGICRNANSWINRIKAGVNSFLSSVGEPPISLEIHADENLSRKTPYESLFEQIMLSILGSPSHG